MDRDAQVNAKVVIVGGGLAGCEAAWQCASLGVPVTLYEMRPGRKTAAHTSDRLAELVCSNSFKSVELFAAHGLLKHELTLAGSLIIECAMQHRLPAGGALAVDRVRFSGEVTARIAAHPLIEVIREEVTRIPEGGPVVIATGPLSSESFAADLARFTGEANLAFYDAISPVIDGESIDWEFAFKASRYGKGSGDDYVNCPFDRDRYEAFIDAVLAAESAPLHEFDRKLLFEGCLPIEEMALRGRDTLRFGPMKPVGLQDPRTGHRPWAVVQLRQDNLAGSHWSMVGFQNRMKWGDQKRVLRLIPGLNEAEFVKLGSMHRNTYVNAPRVMRATFQARTRSDLFFAGQISGVEGYTEAVASGLVAGNGAAALLLGHEPPVLPKETAIGALQRYVANADATNYQPTNFAFGLLPRDGTEPRGKRERKRALAERASRCMAAYLSGSTLWSERANRAEGTEAAGIIR